MIMKKRLIFIGTAVVTALAVLLCVEFGGGIQLLGESHAVEAPCDGVTLRISATSREAEFTITSASVDYIIYESFGKNMELEKLVDGEWYVVRQVGIGRDEPSPISPGNSMTGRIVWSDVYGARLSSGTYRLVYTFHAMRDLVQSDNYTIMQEFFID